MRYTDASRMEATMLFDKAIKSGTLSQSDLAVVSFISQNPQLVVHMTSRQLAEATYVSPSTVVRLCKKAGFDSFGDMKVALAHELASAESYEDVDSDFPQLANASTAQVISRISSMERQAIRKTELLLMEVDWEPILRALDSCRGISLYAIGFSLNPCEAFLRDMAHLGIRTTVLREDSDSRQWAAGCPRDEFSIMLSYSGRTMLTVDAAHILAKRGLKSLSITSEGENKLSRTTTWNIPIAVTEQQTAHDRISHVQSSAEMSYALNVLYALYFSRHYTENVRSISEMLARQGVVVRRERGESVPRLDNVGSIRPWWFIEDYQ